MSSHRHVMHLSFRVPDPTGRAEHLISKIRSLANHPQYQRVVELAEKTLESPVEPDHPDRF